MDRLHGRVRSILLLAPTSTILSDWRDTKAYLLRDIVRLLIHIFPPDFVPAVAAQDSRGLFGSGTGALVSSEE